MDQNQYNEICGETFSSESELENHKQIEHPEQTPGG
jgi:hypothetical protein